eukprot:TRINITY_DN55024_c0_g1_i1.p2 TRINITY_DN55024_c0_g1~~TRINITY_DN55024_c0_g1_i1.p2  ORF type:complete len:105 (-),score=20.84 TRINITY_DN55024_c0_g1_i1:38-352(-)
MCIRDRVVHRCAWVGAVAVHEIRELVWDRALQQVLVDAIHSAVIGASQLIVCSIRPEPHLEQILIKRIRERSHSCLLYTSDAADDEDSVDIGGRRSMIKKNNEH